MTLRAVLIGLAGAWFIAGFGYVNDWMLGLESFTSGHQIPIIVMGFMFLLVVCLNPLLFKRKPSWALRPAEIGVIVILTMTACSIPGRGLMEGFTQALVLPHHWNRITPGWREHGLLDYAPKEALVDPAADDEVVNRYITGSDPAQEQGLSAGAKLARKCRQVPWGPWLTPMRTWLPLIMLTALSSVALALIVHRQWSEHEHLSYPIADFAASLIDRESDEALGKLYRNRLFWLGLGVVFAIRLNNGLCQWFPKYLIPINLVWRFTPFTQIWPSLTKVQWGTSLLYVQVFPLAIAFAFFLSSEISLTLGVSQLLWTIVAIPMVTAGVNLSTDYALGGWSAWQRVGSYVAMALMLIYTGRQYYRDVFGRALLFWRTPDKEESVSPTAVWACRVFLVSTLVLTVLVMRLGAELPFAVGTVVLMFLTLIIVSRISAETGLFFIHPRWQPFAAVLAVFGGYSMGPGSLCVCALVCTVLCLDQSQLLMPYFINALKIGERLDLRPGKVAKLTFGMHAAGVVLAIVIALIATYDFGTPTHCVWSFRWTPKKTFQALEQEVLPLKAAGSLEDSVQLPWFRKLGRMHAKPGFWWAFGIGFALVIAFSVLRLRVPWWPLHPVLFLLWATYPMVFLSHSFMMGWFIKKATLRFGGQSMVKKLRPLMIGIIAGEILGALCFMAAGAIYYACTGDKPISYRFFPR